MDAWASGDLGDYHRGLQGGDGCLRLPDYGIAGDLMDQGGKD
jgi:hypothetical protein